MALIPFDASKKFVCVEYPGMLKESSKVLATLGGLDVISKTVADPSRRLELRLRPNDVYCKPACADHFATSNLVLKVRRRKRSPNDPAASDSAASGNEEPVEASVVGIVEKTYRFQSMCDFQYLPAKSSVKRVLPEDGGFASSEGGKVGEKRTWNSLTPQLFVDKLVSSSWLKEPTPLFLPPSIFSRQDTPVEYLYRPEPKHRPPKAKEGEGRPSSSADDPSTPPVKAPWKAVDDKAFSICKERVAPNTTNLIGVARQRRAGYTIFVNFEDGQVPSRAVPDAVKSVANRIHDERDQSRLEDLKRLFEDRPIWSKNAIKCKIEIAPDKLKLMLPVVAYYFLTGPWRSLWVRLGYDPRLDPTAKKYQLVDFRIRQRSAADKICIRSKRSTYSYSLPNTVQKAQPQVVRIMQESLGEVDASTDSDATSAAKELDESQLKKESVYIFRHGILPPYRQMFYQLCDIYDDEVQSLLVENDGEEIVRGCTWMDGWCVERMQDKARDIISRRLKETLLAIVGEDGSSSKESSSELATKTLNDDEREEDEEEEDCDGVSAGNTTMEDDDEWDSSEVN